MRSFRQPAMGALLTAPVCWEATLPSPMNAPRERTAWLQGSGAACRTPPRAVARPSRLVLLGPPGVGKGTQAQLLSAHTGACALSTGDIFRNAKSGTLVRPSPAMRTAVDCMNRGELVPDDIVLSVVHERLRCLTCRGGFLLDGFPRTVAQAGALNQLLAQESLVLQAALFFDLPTKTIIARLAGRRTCLVCKSAFHLTNRPPKAAGHCDHCGGALVQRSDDEPATVRVRLAAYAKSTAPLIAYYRERGRLRTIDASGTPAEVFQRTLVVLQAQAPGKV